MDESINTANKKQSRQKPPLSVARIAGEIIAGTVTGFAAALLCVFVTNIKPFHRIDDGLFDFLLMSFYFAPPLYGLGSAVGVYLIGSRGKQTGSFMVTLGGGVIGGVVIFIMLPLANRLSEVPIVRLFRVFSPLVLLAPPIAATIGFSLTRRYKGYVLPHVKDMRKAIGESINTPTKKKSSHKPPLSIIRIAGEIITGTVTGFAIAVLASIAIIYMFLYIFTGELPAWSAKGGDYGALSFAALLIGIISFLILYIPATAVGVYLVGTRGNQTGSFLLTLGCGVLLGGLSMFVVLPIAISLGRALVERGTIYISGLLVFVLLIPPILETLCFNLTRRYKLPP